MKRDAFLLLSLVVSLITIGAGCAGGKSTYDSNATPPTSYDSTAHLSTSTYDGRDLLAVSAIIEPGFTLNGTVRVPTKNYTAAINLYGTSGARFQFINCSGNPGTMTIKRGGKFMIDNRDDARHTITLAGQTYTLNAYDFATIQVQKAGDYNITCDGGGAARISVEN